MKPNRSLYVVAALLIGTSPALADQRASRHYRVSVESNASGGHSSSSSAYANLGTVGGIGAAPGRSRSQTLVSKPGLQGSVYEILSLELQADPGEAPEASTAQLGAVATLDDDSQLFLDGADLDWSVGEGPILTVNKDGVATTDHVYTDTPAYLEATVFGWSGDLSLLVLNLGDDDYNPYAQDGLADDWQVRHFGENNPRSADPSADPDGDHQDNAFESQAGTDPMDPFSLFRLAIAPVAGEPSQMNILFHPVLPDRTYTVQAKADLAHPDFEDLEETIEAELDGTRVVTDLSAKEPAKFYRVKISDQ